MVMTDNPMDETFENLGEQTADEVEAVPEEFDSTVELDEMPTTTDVAPSEPRTVYRGSGVRWGFVAGLLLAILLIIVVFQNTDRVAFRFLWWELETPLAALLIATGVVAVVVDELVGLIVRARRRRLLAEKEELKKLREQRGS